MSDPTRCWCAHVQEMHVPAADYDALAAKASAELAKWQNSAVEDQARIAYLGAAMRLIAEGTICPDLFPNDTDENVTAAKTAMTIALAALEHLESETKGEQG